MCFKLIFKEGFFFFWRERHEYEITRGFFFIFFYFFQKLIKGYFINLLEQSKNLYKIEMLRYFFFFFGKTQTSSYLL